MKYIVTGGAGFIGSNLVDKLVSQNHEVMVFDNLSSGFISNLNDKCTFINLDISDVQNSQEMIYHMKNANAVFHLASMPRVQPSIKNPIKFEKNNSLGTVNLLNCAVKSNVKRFIYSASSSAYGNTDKIPMKEGDPVNPISPYAMQKYYGEVICRTFNKVYGIETVSLRYFNVYGERQSLDGAYALVIGAFAKMKKNNKPLTIRGDGNQERDFTYVQDIVTANILASTSPNVGKGEVINIGNGNSKSINDIAKLFGGDVTYIDPVIEPLRTLADNSLAKKLLGWVPTGNLENWILNYKKKLGID